MHMVSIVCFQDPNLDQDGDDEAGEDRLRRLLNVLGTPPMFTTLRVNTLRGTRVDIREHIQTEIDKVRLFLY